MNPEDMARQLAQSAAKSFGVTLSEEDVQTLFKRAIVRNALYQLEARILPPLVTAGAGAVTALLFGLPVLQTMVAALVIKMGLGVTTESMVREIPKRGSRFMAEEIQRLGAIKEDGNK